MTIANQKTNIRGRFYPPRIQSFTRGSCFWGLPSSCKPHTPQVDSGNEAVHQLLSDATLGTWETIHTSAIQILDKVYGQLEHTPADVETKRVVDLILSPALQAWREEQHLAGRKLRSKGKGLARLPDAVVEMLNVGDWPPPLLTASCFFGCFMSNAITGAYDPETMYSNYCLDAGFFYDHGYDRIFPEFETILRSEIANPVARATVGGAERRDVADLGFAYTRRKVDFEKKHKQQLAGKTARLSRDESLPVFLYESGILGMAAEATVRGFDRTATALAFILSSPGTDVVDVGSDIHNSELFNSFLNTADVTDSGVVTEDALRRVYDAYAFASARLFSDHCHNPGVRMYSLLFPWHIYNDRHYLLRRALLGYPKIRRGPVNQRVGDLDEVFDEHMHTTGFSRPLQNACNGKDICDQVRGLFDRNHGDPLLRDVWYYMAEGLVQYVSAGVADVCAEDRLAEGLMIAIARAVSYGCIDDLAWLLCHAGQHAWQVNRLYEASMFGSLLDDGGLIGRLDRAE